MNERTTFTTLFVSRRDDFALQRPDGGYRRCGRALTSAAIHAHLSGAHTLGCYVIDEQGRCSYAVFDADSDDGLLTLRGVQARLAQVGIAAYLEASRRGAHLWVFLTAPALASRVRAWLLPYCPAGLEFYPKQDEGRGYGSLIRLPLGVHQRSGKRYPFVTWTEAGAVPVASSVGATLAWLQTARRVTVSAQLALAPHRNTQNTHTSFSFAHPSSTFHAPLSIRDWCAVQDPFTLIGRYVPLDRAGVGCCPFGEHHTHGQDRHASFKVYQPGVPGGYSWYCHVWGRGGSVFDFLRYYRHLDAAALWHELREGVSL